MEPLDVAGGTMELFNEWYLVLLFFVVVVGAWTYAIVWPPGGQR